MSSRNDSDSSAPDFRQPVDEEFRYWAFISYSHQDEAWAAWLHRGLENYRLPRGVAGTICRGERLSNSLRPIFRDRDELAGASDLGGKIHLHLRQSRTLIVICSPKSGTSRWVNEEIRYFKSLGRADRVLCLIVAGEPHASGHPGSEAMECFPKAIRYELDGSGQPLGEPVEPLAADVRPGKDNREDALLKLIAGMLDIGFDRLKQREARRRRIRRLQMVSAVAGGAVLTVAGYGLLADIGVNVPGRDAIQLALDKRTWSIARAPESEAKVVRTGAMLRNRLVEAIGGAQETNGWLSQTLRKGDKLPDDPFSHSQAMVALCGTEIPEGWDRTRLFSAIGMSFRPQPGDPVPAFRKLYVDLEANRMATDSCGAFWFASLLSSALSREGMIPPGERAAVVKDLGEVQTALEPYLQDAEGGWTMFPGKVQTAPPNAYSTVLALQALLDCKRAGQPWGQDAARRDALLAGAFHWLCGNFDPGDKLAGWRGTGENAYEIFDGLTLQVYATLLRAQAEAGLGIPPEIMRSMERHLIGCVERSTGYPVASGEFASEFDWFGRQTSRKEAYRFLWYPWALKAMEGWLQYEHRHPQPPEQVFRIRRARSHLVVDVGPKLVETVENDWLFIAAETLYGLSSVGSPVPAPVR